MAWAITAVVTSSDSLRLVSVFALEILSGWLQLVCFFFLFSLLGAPLSGWIDHLLQENCAKGRQSHYLVLGTAWTE